MVMSRLSRENFLITGFVCIVFGAFLSVANLGSFAVTIGMFGIVFFITGMSMSRQVGLSPEAVAAWQPDGEPLPDAGRVMFRVDVTLDEPVSSSILCGPCGHVEVREGRKPSRYTCSNCDRLLWEEE
ncbi:MAG: hypothetical protein ISP85_04645 [Candidatus Poseidonia sp.]|nr:hypothetical protein [Poseidonia sp.]MBL6886210.1 hypothetical protein [Poseidonia sp.]